jgi:hypothetical protein
MCVLIFSTAFVWNIIRIIQRDITINVYWYSCKISIILFRFFNEIWSCSADFRKILKNQILWKSFQWEPSSSTQTNSDRHAEANSCFSQFCGRA